MRRLIALALAVACLVAVTGAGAGCDAGDGGGRTLRIDPAAAGPALDEAIPELLRSARVPGAAVALVVDGDVAWSAGYGVTTPGGPPIDAATIFQVGSISKPIAAATVLHLAAQGLIDLDAPVDTMLTGWHLSPSSPDAGAVTLRRLLAHTAGINTGGYLGVPEGSQLPTLNDSVAGASSATEKGPVAQTFEAGTYHYSGGGYSIAQLAIEDVTGSLWADVAATELFQPLAMPSASYGCTTDGGPPDETIAVGHDADGVATPRYRYAELAAAGLCADVADVGRFAAWLAGDDPIAAEMRRPVAGTDGEYGTGVELHGASVGHDGVNRGFNAILLANPGDGSGVVVLTNGDNGRQVVDAVLDLLDS